MKKLKLSILFLLSILFIACDSSDDFRLDDALLPKKVTTKQSYNAEPQYDYMHIITFEYDAFNHPVNIVRETYRRLQTEKENKNVLTYSKSTKLEYLLIEDMVKQTDVIKSRVEDNNYSTHTETRVYNVASGGNNIIEITLDGKYKETIELSGGLAVKYNKVVYSDVPEEKIYNYVEEYKYNAKGDVSEYTYSSEEYTNTERYSYDGYNGIYKHMNIPQWLFISLFGNEGRISNITDIYTSHDNGFVPFAKNINKYNSGGYVQEVEFRPDSEWIGIWGSKTTYEYIKANGISPE